MNMLQFAANVEAGFENSLFYNVNECYQRQTTWCSDLVIALVYEEYNNEVGAIDNTVEQCKKNWPHDYNHIMEMTAACNYLAWLCSTDCRYNKYTKKFSDLYYYFMYDFAEKNLSEEDYLHMIRFLD